ncbi:unnamed protein product [Urochloa humidicola]
MAVLLLPRRRPRALALAVALLLVATSGVLCRNAPSTTGVPSRALLSTPSSSPPPPPPSPDTTAPPPPPFHFPRPICRLCPPRCPPEGCPPGTGGGSP